MRTTDPGRPLSPDNPDPALCLSEPVGQVNAMSTDDAIFRMRYADRLFFLFLNENSGRADLYAFSAGVASVVVDGDGTVFRFHAICTG